MDNLLCVQVCVTVEFLLGNKIHIYFTKLSHLKVQIELALFLFHCQVSVHVCFQYN